MRVLRFGDAALLVEADDPVALGEACRAADLAGVLDVVPAAETVLLVAEPGTDLAGLRRVVEGLDVRPVADLDAGSVEIPVVYDGPDLAEVAAATGLSEDEVVAAHTGTPWRVAFGGFAPGFGYLTGGDERLAVPRRARSRTRVPAGSVALAGEYSAVYPRTSPGGWQLIGRSDVVLWDLDRDPPALLRPGMEVRFVAGAAAGGDRPRRRDVAPTSSHPALEIRETGPRALVQDLGRPGRAAIGVGRSGAADRAALRLGNRLLANDSEGAAAIEVLLGGLVFTARRDLTIALTGAAAPTTVGGAPVGHHALVRVRAGQEVRLGAPPTGLRTYVCVRGGIAVPPVLGSRSTDTLSGIGPAPLEEGAVLAVGPEPADWPRVEVAPVAPPPAGLVTLRTVPGPHAEHVRGSLAGRVWEASAETDRVGMRLVGGTLDTVEGAGSLPSVGITRGAVQLPPGGEPVVFLADHPVTGGYPVIAVLCDADVDRASQVRPGQPVRLTPIASR